MKKTIYASSMFFACALAFVSCGQKTPEMTLEEIEDYRAHAGQHLLESHIRVRNSYPEKKAASGTIQFLQIPKPLTISLQKGTDLPAPLWK